MLLLWEQQYAADLYDLLGVTAEFIIFISPDGSTRLAERYYVQRWCPYHSPSFSKSTRSRKKTKKKNTRKKFIYIVFFDKIISL